MDTWTFGWTLALIGMGGTMLVLWLISVMILLIRKIFPYQAEPSAAKPYCRSHAANVPVTEA